MGMGWEGGWKIILINFHVSRELMNKGKLCFKKNSTNTFQLDKCICTAIVR